jgi:hypothetical protein
MDKIGFYVEASDSFGALKGNPVMHKACLFGIVEIRGAEILLGLSHLKVFSFPRDERVSHLFSKPDRQAETTQ